MRSGLNNARLRSGRRRSLFEIAFRCQMLYLRVRIANRHEMLACILGINFFDQIQKYFKQRVDSTVVPDLLLMMTAFYPGESFPGWLICCGEVDPDGEMQALDYQARNGANRR